MYAKIRTALIAIVIIGAGAAAIGLLSGLLYEQTQRARDRERFPQVGRSVDIGGRSLDLYCSGAGQPVVILQRGAPWALYFTPKEMFENGVPRPGYGWVAIQRELAKTATTCWYDRAGAGWSDSGPYPRDSAAQARDLHELLERAGVAPRYVLVAETSAALDARVYTGQYPADVAGMVFVDGLHPDLLTNKRPDGKKLPHFPEFVGHSQDAVAQIMNQVGLYRMGSQSHARSVPGPEGVTAAEWSTIQALTQSAKARSALVQEIASWQQSAAEARNAGDFGDRPLMVLSGPATLAWADSQTGLARLSTRGRSAVIHGGDEDLIYAAPGAVIEAVRQVIRDVGRQQ